MQVQSPEMKEKKINSEIPFASPEEKKIVRNVSGEKRLSFFSTLTKRMLDNPTPENLKALKEEDKGIKNTYLGV